MLDMHVALKKWAAFSQSFTIGKEGSWLGAMAKKGIKQESEKTVQNGALFHTERAQQCFCCLHWVEAGKQVKCLKRPGRGRKVEEGTPLPLPLHFAYCQTHYLISLITFHHDRSLSELKANLQRHAALENCGWKSQIKRYSINFEIWTKIPVVVGCNRQEPKGFCLQYITQILSHILHLRTMETLYIHAAYSHTRVHTLSHKQAHSHTQHSLPPLPPLPPTPLPCSHWVCGLRNQT